jgi:hypothetical protein
VRQHRRCCKAAQRVKIIAVRWGGGSRHGYWTKL